ncbi:carboxylesterase/lipase family protein [Trinickia sp.]|uniref:carboxylesterase/lipase family protein n=1 Tax=Trinickia sp. TaxID=2571163 RepID=UPI003F808E90
MLPSSAKVLLGRAVARTVAVSLLFVTLCAARASVALDSPSAAPPAVGPRLELMTGTIAGANVNAPPRPVRAFLGIPYAAPPIGALRWQAPQPIARWSGIRQATQFAPRCMQHPNEKRPARASQMSEDCLYLNVWAPNPDTDAKRPVLVYFHGGDLNDGDASEIRYDGANLAAIGVVTVTVNYRLGVFGFLALPSSPSESSGDTARNYGLLDQVAALRWVRENIAAFGGDPANVTIAGDFGGAVAVSAHMASPLSRGLFARAVGQSGGAFGRMAVLSRAQAEQLALRFAAQVGKSTLPQLRALSAEQLLAATGSADDRKRFFWPHVDGAFLTDTPEAVFASGGQTQVPLLLGTRSRERHSVEVPNEADATPERWKLALERLFGDQAAQALSYYPAGDRAQAMRSAALLGTDLTVGHAAWRWMSLHRQTGNGSPVYFYLYERMPTSSEGASEREEAAAAAPSSDDDTLGNLNLLPHPGWGADDYRASSALLRYMIRFVKTGDPSGPRDHSLGYLSALSLGWPERLPAWPAVREERGAIARQRIDVEPKTIWDPSAARHDFIQRAIAAQASKEAS